MQSNVFWALGQIKRALVFGQLLGTIFSSFFLVKDQPEKFNLRFFLYKDEKLELGIKSIFIL